MKTLIVVSYMIGEALFKLLFFRSVGQYPRYIEVIFGILAWGHLFLMFYALIN